MSNKRGSRHPSHGVVRVEMLVRYKPAVPDPERFDLIGRLQSEGWTQITGTSRGKYFQLKLANITLRKARAEAKKYGEKLLANPVTETFEIIKVEAMNP